MVNNCVHKEELCDIITPNAHANQETDRGNTSLLSVSVIQGMHVLAVFLLCIAKVWWLQREEAICTFVRLEVTHVQSSVRNDTTWNCSIGGLDKMTTWHKVAHQPIARTSFNEYKSC